jgi:hypothetical protein
VSTAFYRTPFKKQITGSALGPSNCNMAAAAMLANQATLGFKNPSPDGLRTLSGDTVGGTTIQQAASVLLKVGVKTEMYSSGDGFMFADLVGNLKKGRFAIVHGDYDQVPYRLDGSPGFNGLHSEFWHRVTPDGSGIIVGDPLNDGRRAGIPNGFVTYPMSVARNYVQKFDAQIPGVGLHVALMDLQRVRSRGGAVNIRASATRASTILGTFSGTSTLVWGWAVNGESIGGNSVWYRVWYPAKSRIAYVHSSVVVRV